MTDALFSDPRMAALYDVFEDDRSDLDAYVGIADELGAGSVVDVGCGTGTFACMLAARGLDVVGVDPAAASLGIARAKPFADRVRWVHGDATALSALGADLATMTGNVAQVFVSDEEWGATLRAVAGALAPGAHLAFETRDPAREAWREWTRETGAARRHVPGVGSVEGWPELTEVRLPFVTFRWTYRFVERGTELVSESTLRFRTRDEVVRSLESAGFDEWDVRDAPDRPGRELVFVARRRGAGGAA